MFPCYGEKSHTYTVLGLYGLIVALLMNSKAALNISCGEDLS